MYTTPPSTWFFNVLLKCLSVFLTFFFTCCFYMFLIICVTKEIEREVKQCKRCKCKESDADTSLQECTAFVLFVCLFVLHELLFALQLRLTFGSFSS